MAGVRNASICSLLPLDNEATDEDKDKSEENDVILACSRSCLSWSMLDSDGLVCNAFELADLWATLEKGDDEAKKNMGRKKLLRRGVAACAVGVRVVWDFSVEDSSSLLLFSSSSVVSLRFLEAPLVSA